MRFPKRLLSLTFLVVLSSGCGHPASREECEQILDKIVELELQEQKVTDPAVVEQRKADTRKAKGEAVVQQCVGRRITSGALVCVRSATSYDEINNKCLR
jgi:hypothetical protein